MKKKAFITRTLTDKNVFKTALEAQGFTTEGASMVKFSGLDFKMDKPCDWLFFYSKTAVKYFFQKVKPEQIKDKKIATFGSSTAKALETHGLKADFHGKGDSTAVAKQFLEMAKGKTIAFPRADNSLKSIQKKIANKTNILDIPVYTNVPKDATQASDAEFLCFTSPLNAKTYFENHAPKDNQKLIAIGNTTGQTLVTLTKNKVYISDITSEENLAKMVNRVDLLTNKKQVAQPA